MSDPVEEYLRKYGNGRQAPADPVQSYIQKYGARTPSPTPQPRPGLVRGVSDAAGQGLTLGWGDEIAAGLNAALHAPFSKESLREIYDRELGEERGSIQAFREDHPAASLAAELGGGLTGGLAVGALTGGASAPAEVTQVGRVVQALRLARAGAAAGAVGGAGAAEGGLGERVKGAAGGAAVGAVLAPAAVGAGKLVGRLGSAAADLTGVRPRATPEAVADAVRRVRGGGTALHANPMVDPDQIGATARFVRDEAARRGWLSSVDDRAMDLLSRRVAQSGKTIDEAAEIMARHGDDPLTVMELFGAPVQRLGRLARMVPSQGGTEVADAVGARTREAPQRIMRKAAEAAGVEGRVNPFQAMQEADAVRSANADEAYSAAFDAHPDPIVHPRVTELVDALSEMVPGARRAADRIAQARVKLKDLPETAYFHKVAGEDGAERPAPTLRFLDTLKRSIDSAVNLGERAPLDAGGIDGETAGLVGRYKGELVNLLDELTGGGDPEASLYHQARKQFGDESARIRAMEAGRRLFTENPDKTEMVLAELPESTRDAFRLTGFSGLSDRVDQIAPGHDVPARIASKGMDQRRLHLLLGEDGAERFAQALEPERDMMATHRTVFGGSNTMDKAADLADLENPVPMGFVRDLAAGGWKSALVNAARRGAESRAAAAARGLNEATVDQLGPRLTAGIRDRAELEALLERLREIQARHAQQGGRAIRASGGAAGGFAVDQNTR